MLRTRIAHIVNNLMLLEIFNVEHGACALVTTSNERRALIDCGHNATTGWYAGTALANKGIQFLDRLSIMKFDEDRLQNLSREAD